MIRAGVTCVFVLLAVVSGITGCGDDDDGEAVTPSPQSTPSSPSTFLMEGGSMDPTIPHGTVLDVVPYGDASPERGDIIVFRPPVAPDREFLKRIVGLPGESIEIDESKGGVIVDGTTLTEPYARGPTVCFSVCSYSLPSAGTAEAEIQCGSNACYFVLGDNRQNSSDSRQGWLVPAENIIGRVLTD